MRTNLIFDPALSADELRGFARTVAEIEWLLVILVMLYQVAIAPSEESVAALSLAIFFFAAFVLAFHYANFYRKESYWKIAIETWAMILFITWVLAYTGGAASPLSDLYILVVVVSALTLGKVATLLEMVLIAACFVWLGYPQQQEELLSLTYGTKLLAQIAPMLLVAYITTMLSADLRNAYGHMKALSETDELTGVLNMRAFTLVAERVHVQSERYARPYSVLMIDSDSLKTINDSYGHEAGNRLLKLTITRIQEQLRQTDIVARYGGDEFVVLLPETPCSSAVSVAERIRRGIESSELPTRERAVPVTVSIGVACYPTHGADFESIVDKADQSMYGSKSGGRNRVTVVSA